MSRQPVGSSVVASSSLTRDRTWPLSLEARSLSHWTTREGPQGRFLRVSLGLEVET